MAKTAKIKNMIVETIDGQASLSFLGYDPAGRELRLTLPLGSIAEAFSRATLLASEHHRAQNPEIAEGWSRTVARRPTSLRLGSTHGGAILLNSAFGDGLEFTLSIDPATAIALSDGLKDEVQRLPAAAMTQ